MLTDWAVPILVAAISGVVFTLIYSKIRLLEKVNNKIKSRTLRITLFILAAVLTGVVSSVVRNISDNELLAEIVQWTIFGAIMPFVIGGITSKNGENEAAQNKET